MRLPSENFLSRFLTFHSTSAGGFLEPPPKYMSYSIFSRRSWSSSTLSSSSIAKVAAPILIPIPKMRLLPRGEHLGGIYHRPAGPSYVLKVQSGDPHCGTLPGAYGFRLWLPWPDFPHMTIFPVFRPTQNRGTSS